MEVQYLTVEAEPYVNRKTGETGLEHVLHLMGAEGAPRAVRITKEVAATASGLTKGDRVRLVFGLAKSRWNQHYPVIAGLQPVAAAAR